MKIDVNELTIGQLKEINPFVMANNTRIQKEVPFKVGEKYIIRAVTYHYTGRVKAIIGDFLVLEDSAWIADSGRWNNILLTGDIDECEPFPNGNVLNVNSIVDAAIWNNDLPNTVK